ncbi:hypothetical protein J5X84_02350 [Streptosporangiaceae bacterium NEAU-GS5]|nr:hypothetical protein [Streptosporangiaceae bacterium NEAU-GS5]
MRLEYVLVGLIIVYAVSAIARRANRRPDEPRQQSWPVRAWNAAGLPSVEAPTVAGAAGELVGRTAGRAGRGARRQAAKAGHSAAERAERRWQRRTDDGPRLFRRDAATTGDTNPDGATTSADNTDRADRHERGSKSEGQLHGQPNAGLPRVHQGPRGKPEPMRTRDLRPGDPVTDRHEVEEVRPTASGRVMVRYRDTTTGAITAYFNDPDSPVPEHVATKVATARHANVQQPGADQHTGDDSFTDKGDRYTDRTVTCGACGTTSTITGPFDNHACPTCRRVLNGTGRHLAADLTSTPAPESGAGHPPRQEAPAMTTTSHEHAEATVQALAPHDWAQVAARVSGFDPETDADLMNFMTAEVAGICGYAEAYEALHQTCQDGLGLDPKSVQGLGEFAEHVMELTRAMAAAHKQFLAIYEEVLAAVAAGVVLPYNGRWMTGQAV